MKNDRYILPVEESYVLAIGRAAYIFSYLEWIVVCCCEKMEPNYLYTVAEKRPEL